MSKQRPKTIEASILSLVRRTSPEGVALYGRRTRWSNLRKEISRRLRRVPVYEE